MCSTGKPQVAENTILSIPLPNSTNSMEISINFLTMMRGITDSLIVLQPIVIRRQ